VTINVTDFWKRVEPHHGYCIVGVALPKERADDIPLLLQRLFRLPEFRAKALRMGKIVRLTLNRVEFYAADRHVLTLVIPR
jgi:hypothetical protein